MPEKSDILQIQNTNKNGIGTIARLAMQDRRLTVYAKAIYSYFCSFSDADQAAFPSRDKILYDLDISKNAYYKHLSLLKEYGYITVTQEKNKDGHFARNIYTLSGSLPYPLIADTGQIEHPCHVIKVTIGDNSPCDVIKVTDENNLPHPLTEDTDQKTQPSPISKDTDKPTLPRPITNDTAYHNPQYPISQDTIKEDTAKKDTMKENTVKEDTVKKDTNNNPILKQVHNQISNQINKKISPSSPSKEPTKEPTGQDKPQPTDIHQRIEAYHALIKENIRYNDFMTTRPQDIKLIDELIAIIIDAIFTASKTLRISGEDKPKELVIAQLLKLTYSDIDLVLDKFKHITNRIHKKKQYILTMLYHTKLESDLHYTNLVQYNMCL